MRIVELIIDSESDGINAVSVVDKPAIESNFIALQKDDKQVFLAEVNAEKRIIMGAALIPNKQIYRKVKDDEYYIYFSENTVRQASENFLKNGNQSNVTFNHETDLKDMTVVESWIVDNPEMDKSKNYNLNVPKGTWIITMKVDNEQTWLDIKNGIVKGYSIEGKFIDKIEAKLRDENLIKEIINILKLSENVQLETYNDYPLQATENAKIALRYADKNGWGSCGTAVGKARANQLANKENISRDTISRMASFARQKQNSDKELGDGCGRLMWLAWGGDAGVEWAQRKLKQIDNN